MTPSDRRMSLLTKVGLPLCAAVLLSISGCASPESGKGKAGCGLFNVKGELTVTKNDKNTSRSYCDVKMTYNNIADRTVRPRIKAIYFDANGNTITESHSTFADINPGKSQTVSTLANCNGQTISKMTISEAIDASSCSPSGCQRLCGVYDQDYKWGQ
jgi:hypothetical protein